MALPEMKAAQAAQEIARTKTLRDDAGLMAMSQENNPRPAIGMESMPMEAEAPAAPLMPTPSPNMPIPVESAKTFNTMLKDMAKIAVRDKFNESLS